MSHAFASPAWISAFDAALRDHARIRTESVTWVFGPVLLVVDAAPEHGLAATAIRIELHEGAAPTASQADPSSAALVPTAFGGGLARWKALLSGSLDLVDGAIDGRLRFRGDLPTAARHRTLLATIATAAASVPTAWQDEAEQPATAGASAG